MRCQGVHAALRSSKINAVTEHRQKLSALHILGNVVPMISGVVTAPFTARALGVDGRAVVVVVVTLSVGLLILGTFGLAWITRQALNADLSAAQVWKSRALRVDLVSILPAVLIGILLAKFLRVGGSEVAPVAFVTVLSTAAALRAVWANLLIVSGRAWAYGVTNLAYTGTVVLLTITAYFADKLTVATALWVQAAGLIVQMVVLGFLAELAPSTRGLMTSPGPWVREWRGRIGRSVGGQWIDFAVTRSDLLVVLVVGTRTDLGLYSVAALIPMVIYQVSVTLIQHSWAPGVAISEADRAVQAWQSSVVVGTVLACIGGPALQMLFLPLFGNQFVSVETFIIPACVMAVGLSSVVPAIQHSSTRAQRSFTSLIALLGGAASLAFSWAGAVSPQTAVALLGAVFLVVGSCYVVRTVGLRAIAFKPRKLWLFIRGARAPVSGS